MREKVGMKVVRALNRNNDGVSHAAIDMLCALMQVRFTVFTAARSEVSNRVFIRLVNAEKSGNLQ